MENNDYKIEGKWINKNTGKIVVVTNYVSEGVNSYVVTSEGILDMNDFMNNYIQGDDTTIDEMPVVKESNNTRVNSSTTIFNQEYTFDDDILPETNKTSKETNNTKKKTTKIANEDIIKKFFDKIDDIPQIQTTLTWDNFPKNEISTLINFLDVNVEDISAYIYHNIFTDENIINSITNILMEKLNNDNK